MGHYLIVGLMILGSSVLPLSSASIADAALIKETGPNQSSLSSDQDLAQKALLANPPSLSFENLVYLLKNPDPALAHIGAKIAPSMKLQPYRVQELRHLLITQLGVRNDFLKVEFLFALRGLLGLHGFLGNQRLERAQENIETLQTFLEFSSHPNPYVRRIAFIGLQPWNNEPDVLEKFHKAGHDSSWLVRREAVKYFRNKESIFRGLVDPDPWIRAESFFPLVKYYQTTKDPKAVDVAISCLSDSYPNVKLAAINWLGDMRVHGAIGPLQDVAKRFPGSRPYVQKALHEFTGLPLEELSILKSSPLSFEPSPAPISQGGQSPGTFPRGKTVSTTLQLAWSSNPQAIDILLESLAHRDAYIRYAAVEALSINPLSPIRNTRSVMEALLRVVENDPNAYVRARAARGLHQFVIWNHLSSHHQFILERLGPILTKDANSFVRLEVAKTLGGYPTKLGSRFLIHGLTDMFHEVREWSVSGIDLVCSPYAFEQLATLVQDSSFTVRQRVLHALGMSRNPRAFQLLVLALKDENTNIRLLAAQALGQYANKKALPILKEVGRMDISEDVRRMARQSIEYIKDKEYFMGTRQSTNCRGI